MADAKKLPHKERSFGLNVTALLMKSTMDGRTRIQINHRHHGSNSKIRAPPTLPTYPRASRLWTHDLFITMLFGVPTMRNAGPNRHTAAGARVPPRTWHVRLPSMDIAVPCAHPQTSSYRSTRPLSHNQPQTPQTRMHLGGSTSTGAMNAPYHRFQQ